VLQLAGLPVGQKLGRYGLREFLVSGDADRSCMIVLANDAPFRIAT
jgi:hypothetical protein